MKVLKFKLSGNTAFFKNNEVNAYYYFTYGNIHKVALLGMLGAIMGYGGYQKQQNENAIYPEFYDRLKDLKIAIEPLTEVGQFSKKIHTFNNSAGYASDENGRNLIVKEQWLEEPTWNIYFLIDSEVGEELAEKIINRECVYIPYLGKNDHPANIDDIEVIENVEKVSDKNLIINSLFKYEERESYIIEDDDEEEEEDLKIIYRYTEYLPIGLDEKNNMYELAKFVFTNERISKFNSQVFKAGEKNIVFY
ncbi:MULTISPECIES: type I-B CRISPR-associated protein Cas5b [Peptostreptococcales]|uniref:type I-B CRISPR-associated protein Cas5b n=1 Tax=Peptostreptococcales TaxID=3082720 RepID=UPI000E4C1F23|nr:type I-B CRISPR-associated protein Cas5b [Peptoclostridium sp. AF21-18]RHQ95369.1 type I-B CRISPR-associated protein Cas5 [Peptoclostridium sp. AF21-18]